MRRALALIAVVALCPIGPSAVAGEHELVRPRLTVEEVDGTSRVWVEATLPGGTTVRRLLRETAADTAAGVTGLDPSGMAAFATWDEDGQRWYSWSRDRGVAWQDARPLETALRLRAGAFEPGQALPAVAAGLTLPGDGQLHVVQFRTVGLPEFRQGLASLGVEVHQHLPHNAHLVRLDPGLIPAVAALDFVERVEPYHPAFRIGPELTAWLGDDGPAEATRRVNVMALQWGDAGKRRIADLALDLGVGIDAWYPSGHLLELTVDRSQLRRLAAHDDVLWIDRWTPPGTDMDLVREDAGTNWVETNFGYCGQDVRGEVLDSGIEETHMDFDGIILHGGHDVSSHGTSTYGIVFGNGDRDGDGNSQGTGHMPCPEAQGIFADYGFLGDRFAHTQELKESPYFASFQTNSWGDGQTPVYTSKSHELDDIIWRLDIAILQSQSNTGNQNSRPQAWAKNIIAVGGIKHENTLTEADDSWTGGASIGPAEDGRIKPDINYWYDDIYTTTTGNGYTTGFGGTSGATPEAAGVLGLMLQMWADNVWDTDPDGTTVFEKQPHASTLKSLLINNAKQYAFTGSGADLSRYKQGWGRPNAQIAHERAAESFIVDHELTMEVGQLFAFDVDVLAGEEELKVTMHYPDPPGTTASTLHRINVVTLKVTSPGGTEYHGNVGLTDGTESTSGGSPNTIDTVQNVFVTNPTAGTWIVEVEAVEVNQDAVLETPETDVTFSLVVTGGTGAICDQPLVSFTATPNPARVGDTVQFDATVSGGAGGPYEYRWDFDLDGDTDSTEEDPAYVFSRPYDGDVKLRVRDAALCPEKVKNTMTVNGPDLRFDSVINLAEVSGNGNGAVDPGEVWDLTVQLRNDGSETATSVTAEIAIAPTNPGPITLLQTASAYGDIGASAVAAGAAAYRVEIGQGFPCGFDMELSVVQINSTDPVNTYPDEVGAVKILVGGAGPKSTFLFEGFESPSGWTSTGNGEWQRAAPQGLGGGNGLPGQNPRPDPSSAFEGSLVIGTDLTGQGTYLGNYEDDVTSTFTSPAIDASGAADIELHLYRWLNLMLGDNATIEISNDGLSWTEIYAESSDHEEEEWVFMNFDVSAVADGQPNFRIRFGLTSNTGFNRSGWNVDALELIGVTKDSCEPFVGTAAGESTGLTMQKNGGDLDLSWSADCGAGDVYGVYRGDLAAGYGSVAAEPGQCDLAGTATSVPAGAGAADFFLVVPALGSFDGSYGADSSGSPRPPAGTACHPQDTPDACAP